MSTLVGATKASGEPEKLPKPPVPAPGVYPPAPPAPPPPPPAPGVIFSFQYWALLASAAPPCWLIWSRQYPRFAAVGCAPGSPEAARALYFSKLSRTSLSVGFDR